MLISILRKRKKIFQMEHCCCIFINFFYWILATKYNFDLLGTELNEELNEFGTFFMDLNKF